MIVGGQEESEQKDSRLASIRKSHVRPRLTLSGNVGVPVWKPATGWSVIVLMFVVIVFAWVAVLEGRGNDILNRSIDRLASLIRLRQVDAPRERAVLFVSSSQVDQLSVMTTLQPRGYIVHFAEDARQALQELDVLRDRVALVLIDSGVPKADTVLSAARKTCPGVHILFVRRSDQPGYLPTLLMNSDVLGGLVL